MEHNERERITILITRGCGDCTRFFQETARLFHSKLRSFIGTCDFSKYNGGG